MVKCLPSAHEAALDSNSHSVKKKKELLPNQSHGQEVADKQTVFRKTKREKEEKNLAQIHVQLQNCASKIVTKRNWTIMKMLLPLI